MAVRLEFPGDCRKGLIDFRWDKQTDEWKRQKRTVELNNGRGVMIGILGIMVHEQLGNLNGIDLRFVNRIRGNTKK